MNYSPSDIKQAVSIYDLVSEDHQLKRSGNSYRCRCPFHDDDNPSFVVTPSKGLFHCFGCRRGGDVFEYVRLKKGMTFPEAKDYLLERSGLVTASSLYELNHSAMEFYQHSLSSNLDAQNYLCGRSITGATAQDMKLGSASNEWNALYTNLKANFPTKQLIDSGLVRKGKNGYYDFFKKRVVIPIFDLKGRVVGFSGRAYDKKSTIPHLITRDNSVHSKNASLLNFQNTEPGKPLLVVEGAFDLFAVWQNGGRNVVAVQTNSISPAQAKMMCERHPQIWVCFDAGKTGRQNLESSLENLLLHTEQIKIVQLSYGDPHKLISDFGYSRFREELKRAKSWRDVSLQPNR